MRGSLSQRIRSDSYLNLMRQAEEKDVLPYFKETQGSYGPYITVSGEKMLNFGSNNYLSLTTDQRVIEKAKEAISNYGTGNSGSRLLNGTLDLHNQLENRLAEFYEVENALVYPSGYTANVGLFSTILDRTDIAVVDSSIHASIYDGIQQSKCRIRSFYHNDANDLEKVILRCEVKPIICVVEGVYSMNGDAGKLKSIVDVCDKYDVSLVVDEAHSLGVLGREGRGASEMYNVLNKVDIFTVTFSKSLGSCGGAVLGSRELIDFLKIRSRPFIFTASNTPSSLAATLSSLNLIKDDPSLISELNAKRAYLFKRLSELQIETISQDSAIIALKFKSDEEVFIAWNELMINKIYNNPVIYPAVEKNKGIIRLSIMRAHEYDHLDKLVNTLKSTIVKI